MTSPTPPSDTVRELRLALHRFEQSFLHSPLATIECNCEGQILRWNPAAEQIFGWSAEEAVGRNLVELLVPGVAREQVGEIIAALTAGKSTNNRNLNVTRDGRLITCQWYNAVLYDEDGKAVGWISQTEDVTGQLEAEAQLRQSEEYMKTIFGAMDDMVLIIERDGTYRDVAPTQPELRYGHSRKLRGRRIQDIVPPEEAAQYLEVISQVLADGITRQHHYRFPGPNGLQDFDATVSRLSDDTVLWVARDVTEQRKAEAELAALQEQVIEAQRAALRELSTPIIPIADGVVAMPLIGSIDSTRAQLVIETLLDGVSRHKARTAILDITGVMMVDTQVANGLLRAAQAVKLLGAQTILTGVRPEVAQTLVGLGLDLSGIRTLATLQSGIAYALATISQGDARFARELNAPGAELASTLLRGIN